MKSDGKLIGVHALLKNMGGCRCCLRFRRKPGPGKLCEVWIPVFTGMAKMGSLALFQQPVKEEISVCGDGPRSNLMSTVALVLLAGSLLLGTPAAAADVEAPKPSLAKLAQEFTDPLTTLPQIFTQNVYTPTNFGTDAPANRLIVRAIIPRVPESSLLPFVQLIRPSVSLVTVPTGTGSGTQTAFGDMQLFDLAVLPWPGRESGLLMGVGPVFVFPTATEKAAGQGAWQAGPAFGAIYKGIPSLIMGCLIQNPISFAYTSSDRRPVSTLLVQPILAVYLGKGFYVKSADATWTMGWRSGSATMLPLSLGLGYVLLHEDWPPLNFFVSGEWMAYRDNAPIAPQMTVRLGLTIAFPQFRPW